MRDELFIIAAGFAALVGCNKGDLLDVPVAPIAVVGGPLTARATETVELVGADSYDPNSQQPPGIARYRWSVVSAPAGSGATIDSSPDDWRNGLLTTDQPGRYTIDLEVRDENDQLWSEKEQYSVQVLPISGFFAQLTWTTDVNDVDLHLIDDSMGSLFDEEGDCHFANLRPDWGADGDPNNPALSLDDVDGYGPEVVELEDPILSSDYHLMVHYFSDDGFGTTDTTLDVYVNGNLVQTLHKTLEANQIWDVGTMDWSGPTGTLVVVDQVSVY